MVASETAHNSADGTKHGAKKGSLRSAIGNACARQPPVTIRAIKPGGDVRLGVCGSLSAISSMTASTVKIPTEGTAPMRESGRWIFSQPRCTAHAVVAGAISERSPAKNPIRKAKRSFIVFSRIALAAQERAPTRRSLLRSPNQRRPLVI